MSFASDQPSLVNQLPLSVDFPKDFLKFLEIHTELYKRTANILNTKEGSLYSLQEYGNFNSFYTTKDPQTFRNVYRKTFDVVALNGAPIPGGATVTFPHNIVGIFNATLIYASCTSSASDFFTVVYPDARMDATDLFFTNPLPGTTLTAVSFIAEYTKN